MSTSLYDKIRFRQHLWPAWRHVRQKGLQSQSREIREAVKDFDFEADSRLKRIKGQLQRRNFQFRPAQGFLKERPGKVARPIVVSHLEDRIVQRSILSVLQSQPPISDYIRVPTSYGGLEERGVRDALAQAVKLVRNGSKYYARSDIEDFFRSIPKNSVLRLIGERINDREFLEFLAEAIQVELENLGPLGRDAELFPLHEIGVAQGCCLSPLLGNILLHQFDLQLNGRKLHCLRYIDDFLLLGPSETHVRKGFESALRLLGHRGLTAYDPWAGDEKAQRGFVANGYEFLGCEVSTDQIRPGKKARKRLLTRIRELLDTSARVFRSRNKNPLEAASLVVTLREANNVLRGWGNQYSFCNDPRLWGQLDGEIDSLLRRYLGQYRKARDAALKEEDSRLVCRRLLGVHLLEDSKSEPILRDE